MRSLRAVAFDLGHTVMDERLDFLQAQPHEEWHLMPGVREAFAGIRLPIAIWANTRVARADDVRSWLARAGLSESVRWVTTSVDAGARKPAPAFFDYALRQMALDRDDVLFVGNQRNTDITGADAYGIATVYLRDAAYRSPDDADVNVEATHEIDTLSELPVLVTRLLSGATPSSGGRS